MNQEILRLPAVLMQTGLSRSTIYAYIASGLWSKPVNIGVRAVGWPATEVRELTSARIAGQSDEEIRVLVKKLERDRRRGVVTSSWK